MIYHDVPEKPRQSGLPQPRPFLNRESSDSFVDSVRTASYPKTVANIVGMFVPGLLRSCGHE